MADGDAGLFDFSDLGGQRVGQALDFSDLGGQRVEEADDQQPSGGFFGKFADLGAISVENHPEWLEGWTPSTSPSAQPQDSKPPMPPKRKAAPIMQSQPPNQQARPFDFSDLDARRVSFAPTEPSQPDRPGFSQRWAEGMGIPVTQEEEDAMREEMKPKWYDVVAPQWRGLKMVGGMVKNAWEQQKEGLEKAYQRGRDIGQGAPVFPALMGVAADKAEADIKSLPGGQQLWNFGQDIHEGNYQGAAGTATAAFLQAALADALFGERPNAPKPPTSSVPPIVSAEERVPTRHPVADTPEPSGNYEPQRRTPASKSPEPERAPIAGPPKGVGPTGSAAPGELPADLQELLERINRAGDRTDNCGLCVDAFAKTLNGNESFAGEGNVSVEYLEEEYHGRFTDATLDEIESELLSDEEGAHAIVKGEYPPGADGRAYGHVFNAVHWNDGRVYFVDPQSGTIANTSLFRRFQYFRSD